MPGGTYQAAVAQSQAANGGGEGKSKGDTVSLQFNTFIPQSTVDAPFGQGTYKGDGRDVGDPGTHRTQQTVMITEDPSGKPHVSVGADIGQTHKLDAQGHVIETGQAAKSTVQSSQEVEKDGTVVVHLHGQSGNPLAHVDLPLIGALTPAGGGQQIDAPGITYDETITAKKESDGRW